MGVKNNGFIGGSLPEGLDKQLLLLASKWGDHMIDMNTLQVVRISGGLSNEVYCVSWPTITKDDENVVRTVLVRIYGEGVNSFVNRDDEIRAFKSISMLEHGPKLLAHFPGGRIEEFIHARTLSASDLRDPETSGLIAAKLREFNNLDMPGVKKPMLWELLRNSLTKARSLSTAEQAKEFRLDDLEEEIGMLESELSQGYQDIGFCHNDLQYGNIMIDEKTRSIYIIDYEYASYNPVAYDIAIHFCKMAANYQAETPPILNFNMYPELEERQRFVRLYLASAGHPPSDADVVKLVNEAEKYTLANHLWCSLWCIISNYLSNIDFDYIDCAKLRLEQYWLRKPLLLGITAVKPVDHVNGFTSLTT